MSILIAIMTGCEVQSVYHVTDDTRFCAIIKELAPSAYNPLWKIVLLH
jgi:hypothetical protein